MAKVCAWVETGCKQINCAPRAVERVHGGRQSAFRLDCINFGPKPIVGWGVSSGRFRRILIKGTTLQVAARRRLRRGEFAHRIDVGERVSRQPLALRRFNVGYLNWFVCVDLAHRRGDQYGTEHGIAPRASMAIRVGT
jgi:hypothetical protein